MRFAGIDLRRVIKRLGRAEDVAGTRPRALGTVCDPKRKRGGAEPLRVHHQILPEDRLEVDRQLRGTDEHEAIGTILRAGTPAVVGPPLGAREIARGAGLNYVYVGNCREVEDAETTFCPNCHKPVIERRIYSVGAIAMKDGKCNKCGTQIAGVWSA